jgi:hypothetical protein
VNEIVHNGSSQGAWTLLLNPHQEFRELCALSTTGELTAEEWMRLSEHLAQCRACRKVKEQYERVAGSAMPAVAAEAELELDEENAPGSWSIEEAEATLMESLRAEPTPLRSRLTDPPKRFRWKYAYALRYAMAAVILVACGLIGYRIGLLREQGSNIAVAPATTPAPRTGTYAAQSATSTVPAQAKTAAPADDQTAQLRNQVRQSELESAGLKEQLSQLERELDQRSADLDRLTQDRADLNRQLTKTQADELSLQARLDLIGKQSSQDAAQSLALTTQVNDLSAALEQKDRQIAQQQQLLDHDRDIRNVIGARNLYIAEIYDVAKNGDTQKPFGRVFYTKDKSLVFYGYDLDQQRGVKKDSAFQAWGRGADRTHDVSLGLLYQDDANQKRWVLKFNDAKTISEIDEVFVTVEPEGGSAKPSGKPLLFTYLRLDPNHP